MTTRRWIEEEGVSAETRRVLDAARDDGPRPEQIARMDERMATLLAAAPAAAGTWAALRALVESKLGGGAVGAKVGTGAAAAKVGAGVIAGKIGLAVVAVATAGTLVATGTVSGPGHRGDAGETASRTHARDGRAARRSVLAPRPVEADEQSPELVQEPAASGEAVSDPREVSTNTVSRGQTPVRTARRARALAAQPSAVPAPDPEAAAQIELALISAAEDALRRDDPQAALDLTAEHEASGGPTLLEQEREVIAIDALARLGRRSEAETRAVRFLERFPGSTHERRILRIVERLRGGP